jgi:hypothetical protein
MAAGLQIFNDSGFVQIDANYLNMELKQRGNFSLPGNGTGAQKRIDIQFAGESPIIAINCSDYCFPFVSGRNGNTTTFSIYNSSANNVSGEFYIFDNSNNNSLSDSGFQVFNEQGRLVFDAGKLYMRVLDNFSVESSGRLDKNYPGKKFALAMTDYGWTYLVMSSPVDPASPNKRFKQTKIDSVRGATNSLSVEAVATYTDAYADTVPGEQSKYEGPSRWLVVDVTNY